ncbi:hypothetical protein J3R30DRAFT_1329850 [Lentinula aciculospora]|uniref:Uncharacterized protein n=1 Tax=Lentinula aciculospora TaxID=153920 RepID=A0A9W9AKZ9_9AGAR|nr:hypothetical protein J3R30DRAFT_1329850 [Lentinula aciculospora]
MLLPFGSSDLAAFVQFLSLRRFRFPFFFFLLLVGDSSTALPQLDISFHTLVRIWYIPICSVRIFALFIQPAPSLHTNPLHILILLTTLQEDFHLSSATHTHFHNEFRVLIHLFFSPPAYLHAAWSPLRVYISNTLPLRSLLQAAISPTAD